MALVMSSVPTLTVEDAAKILGTSATFVRQAIRRGELGYSRMGRLIRLHPDDLEAYVNRARRPPSATQEDQPFAD